MTYPESVEEILRAHAVLFWFNLYPKYPDFSTAGSMFPRGPDIRQKYLAVHSKVSTHWATAANRMGIPTAHFRDVCTNVRVAWIGPDDPLRARRSRADVLSDRPELDLDQALAGLLNGGTWGDRSTGAARGTRRPDQCPA